MKNLLVLVVLCLVLGACKTSKTVSEEVTKTKTEETFKTKQTIDVNIPAKTVTFGTDIPVFTPIRFVENGKIVHVHHFQKYNSDSSAIYKGRIDSLGHLFITERQAAYDYKAEVEVQNKIIREFTEKTTVVERQLNWLGKLWQKIQITGASILFILVLLVIIYKRIKKYLPWA